MQAHLFASLSLGVVGIIALGALPSTAHATKVKEDCGDKDHKDCWCHATASPTNPYVTVDVSKSASKNKNDKGHDHLNHAGDMPATWSDDLGKWTCEEEEPPTCELDTPDLQVRFCEQEEVGECLWQWASVFSISPDTAYFALNTQMFPLGPVYKVTYEALSLPEGDYEGRISITNLNADPNALYAGPVVGASNDLGQGMYEDSLYGSNGYDDAGLVCGLFTNFSGVWCTGDLTGNDEVQADALNDCTIKPLRIQAALYAPGEELAACASELDVAVAVGCS
ncbi:MAG: hypothetical protein JRI25_10640 [Deltaproteobacteria bacterium]|nr:hypothetical protein [Deltaproteobacteria bacterium]